MVQKNLCGTIKRNLKRTVKPTPKLWKKQVYHAKPYVTPEINATLKLVDMSINTAYSD